MIAKRMIRQVVKLILQIGGEEFKPLGCEILLECVDPLDRLGWMKCATLAKRLHNIHRPLRPLRPALKIGIAGGQPGQTLEGLHPLRPLSVERKLLGVVRGVHLGPREQVAQFDRCVLCLAASLETSNLLLRLLSDLLRFVFPPIQVRPRIGVGIRVDALLCLGKRKSRIV